MHEWDKKLSCRKETVRLLGGSVLAGAKPQKGLGVQTPHTSHRRLVGFAQIRFNISSFRRGGYPCIPGWPGEAIQSTQNIEKPQGDRGSAPNPAGGAHSAPPDSLTGGADCPLPQNPTPSQMTLIRS